ncbi:MAG TPA: lytic transglycosylase domain-containing protein [Fimbriimonadaceae bacterium]|nr:lytic transglycosylase domain-containing protein [Fimbriimonadaceae bacterium]
MPARLLPLWKPLAFGSVLAIACLAQAQTLPEYLKLRKKYGIKAAAGVAALDTLFGSRVVEIAGTVKGSFTINGDHVVLLERTDGKTDMVHAANAPDWLSGNEVRARLIVSAKRETVGGELEATLIGAASEISISQVEEELRQAEAAAAARRPKSPVAYRPPSGNRARKLWTLPVSEVTPIYAAYIHKHNPRLSSGEALHIAEALVGFSVQYGVDARLIMAIVIAESDFNPNETSNKGAMGLGQLMPGTARDFGITNAYDTTENLYGTVREITNDLKRYEKKSGKGLESLALALAAYNAGIGAVARAGGVPPYRATQNYVRKVIRLYYGFCGIRS